MRFRFLFRLLGIVLLIAPFTNAQQQIEMAGLDIVIHGGRIIDGTGNPWYVGDIAITNGRIVAIGKIPSGIAKRVIEAKGLVVAPGFIDMLGIFPIATMRPLVIAISPT